jgi:EIX receptor 1/2
MSYVPTTLPEKERPIMRGPYAELLLLFGLLLCDIKTTLCFSLNLRNSKIRCIEEERQALFRFKQGLQDNYGMLSSWVRHEEDCCKWKGIGCNNRTGHVVKLDLRGKVPFAIVEYWLSGEISSSLLGLQHLTYLDLSVNDFHILPNFIGSFTKLQYLNLSWNSFSGTIPPQLGNLSSLISLDLSWNKYGLIKDHNLDWLIHLSSLRYLDMSYMNLSKVVNWLDKLNMLPSLSDLRLSYCELSMPVPPVLSNAINSSSPLSFLDLSSNHLNSSVFPWLFKYCNSLVHLDLSHNEIEGLLPKAFENMVALVHINLSFNKLEGAIPDLTKLSLLRELHLSNNQLNESLDNVLGKLSKLQALDVSFNFFKGVVTEAQLSNLSSLKHLGLSFNSLSLNFTSNWVPPFHLNSIGLSSCKLGPAFPQWLQTQKNFSRLDISNARISDTIPNWFWDLSSNIVLLNISNNQIVGTIPLQWFLTKYIGSYVIDLSQNRFSGPLPHLNSDALLLNLSNNLFQGTITFKYETNRSSLYYLDLSNNLLFGVLPEYLENMTTLISLNFANNNLSGRIPESFGRICSKDNHVRSLHFQNNSFSGELPVALMNCSLLKVIDFGENKLFGRIPTWIGTSLKYLVALRLPSNMFVGSIPLELCQLTSLQILDLSNNNISGTIPRCLKNFTAMAQKDLGNSYFLRYPLAFLVNYDFAHEYLALSRYPYIEHAFVNTKGLHLDYSKILGLVKVINLSSNRLKGEIPREITSLVELIGLNLSGNLLTGIIPLSIGDLKGLDSLDLSSNHLSSVIPTSLATLSFLGYLNLSNNNLSGKIPTSTQLQSFSAYSYAGNKDLCGLPLMKRCLGDETPHGPQIGNTHREGNIQEHLWFYASIAIGFIVGFWGVCATLVLKSSWRHAYFQFLDRMGDKLYFTIAINMAKVLRNFKTHCKVEVGMLFSVVRSPIFN